MDDDLSRRQLPRTEFYEKGGKHSRIIRGLGVYALGLGIVSRWEPQHPDLRDTACGFRMVRNLF